jgi:hypothetical protein
VLFCLLLILWMGNRTRETEDGKDGRHRSDAVKEREKGGGWREGGGREAGEGVGVGKGVCTLYIFVQRQTALAEYHK